MKTREEKRAYMRAWKKANPEKVKEANRKRSKTAAFREYQSKWKKQRRQIPEVAARERARVRTHYARNAERYRIAARGGGAGLTPAQFSELLVRCAGRCQLCGVSMSARVNVDHCHTTGRVRGLLCTPCNIFVGYLEKHLHRLDVALAWIGAR